MLVLTRKEGQRIQIGNDISITVVAIRGKSVRLGFDGPDHVTINREEIHRRLARGADDRLEGKSQADACRNP